MSDSIRSFFVENMIEMVYILLGRKEFFIIIMERKKKEFGLMELKYNLKNKI